MRRDFKFFYALTFIVGLSVLSSMFTPVLSQSPWHYWRLTSIEREMRNADWNQLLSSVDRYWDREIIQAAHKGDLERVKDGIAGKGWTKSPATSVGIRAAFLQAARLGHKNVVAYMLQELPEVYFVQSGLNEESVGELAIWAALTARQYELTELLIGFMENKREFDNGGTSVGGMALRLSLYQAAEAVSEGKSREAEFNHLKRLVEFGVNPNQSLKRNFDGVVRQSSDVSDLDRRPAFTTALTEAVLRGDAELFQFLVGIGADPKKPSFLNPLERLISSHKFTIQHRFPADSKRILPLAKLLISAGVHIDQRIRYTGYWQNRGNYVRSEFWLSPVMLAVEHALPDVVKELIRAGAKVTKEDLESIKVDRNAYFDYADGSFRLNESYYQAAQESFDLLLVAHTPLLLAIHEGDSEEVRRLLDAGANPNTESLEGSTALILAIRQGDEEIVSALLEAGANVNSLAQIRNGNRTKTQTALTEALITDSTTLFDQLIEAGGDPDFAGSNGRPALMAWVAKPKIVEKLISLGADLDAQSVSSGETALMTAASSRNAESMSSLQMIMNSGANLNIQDHRGRTALHHAVQNFNDQAFERLFFAGADLSISVKDGKTLEELLEGLTPRSSDAQAAKVAIFGMITSQHPHIEAAVRGDGDTLKKLLAAGADIEAKDKLGQTALIAAIENGQVETAKSLVENGADYNATNASGQTALELAASKDDNLTKLMMTKGARFEDNFKNLVYADTDAELTELAKEARKDLFLQFLNEAQNPVASYRDPLSRIEIPAYRLMVEHEIKDPELWQKIDLELPIVGRVKAAKALFDEMTKLGVPQEVLDRLQKEIDDAELIQQNSDDLGSLLAAHLLSFNERARASERTALSPEEAKNKWNEFVALVKEQEPNLEDLRSLKLAIEEALKKMNNDQEIVYNKDSVSVFDAICDSRLQCYSGSILFHQTATEIWPEAYSDAEPLAILVNGHILPGFARKNFVTKEWDIFGIESTATGEALVSYGPAPNLGDEEKAAMRILGADGFMHLEEMKFNGAESSEIKARTAAELERAAEEYGLPLEKMEEKVKAAMESSGVAGSNDINGSPWAFGESHTEPGDLPRDEIKPYDASQNGTENVPGLGQEPFEAFGMQDEIPLAWAEAIDAVSSAGYGENTADVFVVHVLERRLNAQGIELSGMSVSSEWQGVKGFYFHISEEPSVFENVEGIIFEDNNSAGHPHFVYTLDESILRSIHEAFNARDEVSSDAEADEVSALDVLEMLEKPAEECQK